MAGHKADEIPEAKLLTDKNLASVFRGALNVLNRATAVADNFLGKQSEGSKKPASTSSEFDHHVQYVRVLKEISCEVGCKAANEGYEATLKTISQFLSAYTNSSAEKAVLILAALALDYGELWLHFDNFNVRRQFSLSFGHLRRVTDLNVHLTDESFKTKVGDLNDLVKGTMELIQCIFELEMTKLSMSKLDRRNVPELVNDTVQKISECSDLAIKIVAACIVQVTCSVQGRLVVLNGMRKWISRLEDGTKDLKRKQEDWRQYVERTKIITDLNTIFHNRHGDTEFIIKFISCIHVHRRQTVLGEFHPQRVCVYLEGKDSFESLETLKEKNIVIFISGLDIKEGEIEDLTELKANYKEYKIIWIPIVDSVEQWEIQLKKNFEDLRKKLPVYTVENYRPVEGMIKYVKEKWQFSSKPMVVLIDQRGSVTYRGEFQIIKTVGINAIKGDKTPASEDCGISKIFRGHEEISEAIRQEKYIFFYGGRDSKWVHKFRAKIENLQRDVKGENGNNIFEKFCIEEGGKDIDKTLIEQFWVGIQSLHYVSMQYWINDPVSIEIQRLFSCKNEIGWALLCKGSSILLGGHGKTMFSLVNDYSIWRENLIGDKKRSFHVSIREYHKQVAKRTRLPCLHLEIKSSDRWLAEPIKCPNCDLMIETVITYKCCHGKNKESGYGRVLEIFWDEIENLKAPDPFVNAIIQWLLPQYGTWLVPRYGKLLLLFAFVLSFVNVCQLSINRFIT